LHKIGSNKIKWYWLKLTDDGEYIKSSSPIRKMFSLYNKQ
jgi:hypothetical protein